MPRRAECAKCKRLGHVGVLRDDDDTVRNDWLCRGGIKGMIELTEMLEMAMVDDDDEPSHFDAIIGGLPQEKPRPRWPHFIYWRVLVTKRLPLPPAAAAAFARHPMTIHATS